VEVEGVGGGEVEVVERWRWWRSGGRGCRWWRGGGGGEVEVVEKWR